MKNKSIRHGELILQPIAKIPTEAKLEKEVTREIVAHSETGHHHILETTDMSKIKIYSWNGDRYLEVPEMTSLWHQKTGNDVHKTHKVSAGTYKINIKKEYDYFLKKIRAVRD